MWFVYYDFETQTRCHQNVSFVGFDVRIRHRWDRRMHAAHRRSCPSIESEDCRPSSLRRTQLGSTRFQDTSEFFPPTNCVISVVVIFMMLTNIRIFADSQWLQLLIYWKFPTTNWWISNRHELNLLTLISLSLSLPGHMRIYFPEWSLHSTARSHRCCVDAALGENFARRSTIRSHGEGRQSCDPGKVLR